MNLKIKRNIVLMGAVVCPMLLSVTACKDDDADVAPLPEVAYVSLYNASPNSPGLDIIVDDRAINSYSFDYTDYTGYARFYTGNRNLEFGPSGANNVVVDTTVTFEKDKAYSVFVVDDYQDLDVLVLNDDTNAAAQGKAMIRFLNLSPDSPATDLAIKDQSSLLFDNQEFKEDAEFKEIDAATYNFEVRHDQDAGVLLNIPNITLQAGWHYTLLVRGYTSPPVENTHVLSGQVIVN